MPCHPTEPLSTTYRAGQILPADAPFRIGETIGFRDGIFVVESLQFINREKYDMENYWRVNASAKVPTSDHTVGIEGAAYHFKKL